MKFFEYFGNPEQYPMGLKAILNVYDDRHAADD